MRASATPVVNASPIDCILSVLSGVRRRGVEYVARCPAHEDRSPSLSIGKGDDGRVLLHCHAGCTPEAIMGCLGMSIGDLFAQTHVTAEVRRHRDNLGPAIATYDYHDEAGATLFQVRRYHPPAAPKTFRQFRPDGRGGWLHGLGDVRRVLYGLDRLRGKEAVCIVEGEKDADRLASLKIPATSNPMGAGKWSDDYAQQLDRAGNRRVAILPDNDTPGENHAAMVAHSCHAAGLDVCIVRLPDLPPKGDVSDWLDAGHTAEELRAYLKEAEPWTPPEEPQTRKETGAGTAKENRLVELLSVEDLCTRYRLTATDLAGVTLADLEERLRDMAPSIRVADALRLKTIAGTVKANAKVAKLEGAADIVNAAFARKTDTRNEDTGELIRDDEPWPTPVDGATLLNDIATKVRTHVVLDEAGITATSLWVVLTYVSQHVSILPMLLLTSATKRCGKSTLITVLWALTRRAVLAGNITPAALFRTIEKYEPTLLLDEIDTYISKDRNSDLTGIINSGHMRLTAQVVRCVGEEQEPTIFTTYCPKVLAGIGKPSDTIVDRSIELTLRRKGTDDSVQSIRADRINDECVELRRRLTRWASDHGRLIADAEPILPAGLNDRAADNWRGLIAIADSVVGTWGMQARAAALALASVHVDDEPPVVQLLADLRDAFGVSERLATKAALEHLLGLEERPWATWRNEKPMNANTLARQLKPFGIRPTTYKEPPGTAVKGYIAADFAEAWAQYLPSTTRNVVTEPENTVPIDGATRNQPSHGLRPRPTRESIDPAPVTTLRVAAPSRARLAEADDVVRL